MSKLDTIISEARFILNRIRNEKITDAERAELVKLYNDLRRRVATLS